ncbi:AI-2E family transporter [Luteolibacter yonseiensis]|uniref:AI-2E family transporter n=1 Tax=Luteolibacter yonseiensis TaxID=1144680 RepID=A0A934VBR4_9BACT|nr:AI-2E family transporter [Luteolibacter yonseiensis]MBK1817553.1 AI-2E family transporter [Luteolibacter yonseiensis]
MRYPTEFQQKTLWNAATGVSILVLGALIVALVWLLGYVFGFLQPVLIPLIVAGIIAYVLDPVVRLLEKRGMSRLWSVVSLFVGILIAITLLVAAVLPGIQRSHGALREFMAKSTMAPVSTTAEVPANADLAATDDSRHLAPALTRSLNTLRRENADGPVGWLLTETDDLGNPREPARPVDQALTLDDFAHTRGGRMLVENLDVIFNTGKTWLTAGSSKVLGFLGLMLGMIMVPVYLFFFLKESAAIRTHWHDYVPLKASRFKTSLVDTLQEINGYLVSFFRGQVLVAAIDGMLVGIALTIFGLPYGLLIGVFMALLGVIPYIGNILCLIPACIIGYLHAQSTSPFGMGPWAYVGCVVAIFVIVQQINSLVTAPKIVGDSVGLHPLTVIFSMLFWSLVLGGFVGALLAVPLTAAVKVLFRRFIWERKLKEGAGAEAVPTAAEI